MQLANKVLFGFGCFTFGVLLTSIYFVAREKYQKTNKSAEKKHKSNGLPKNCVEVELPKENKPLSELNSYDDTTKTFGNSSNSGSVTDENSLPSNTSFSQSTMDGSLSASNNRENAIEIYVSAVASPAKFWIQKFGPEFEKLNELMEKMTKYYSFEENRATHRIEKPHVGQIVATLFKFDSKWYRAEVVAILPNKYNPNEMILDLFFVDSGESEYALAHEIFDLRSDFLNLRFQAIECFLANVVSTLPNDPDTWNEQSIAAFEQYTEAGYCKQLLAHCVTRKDRIKSAYYSARQGSSIPGIEIYQTYSGDEMSLSEMMIHKGYAYRSNNDSTQTKSPQQDSSSSTDDLMD